MCAAGAIAVAVRDIVFTVPNGKNGLHVGWRVSPIADTSRSLRRRRVFYSNDEVKQMLLARNKLKAHRPYSRRAEWLIELS